MVEVLNDSIVAGTGCYKETGMGEGGGVLVTFMVNRNPHGKLFHQSAASIKICWPYSEGRGSANLGPDTVGGESNFCKSVLR